MRIFLGFSIKFRIWFITQCIDMGAIALKYWMMDFCWYLKYQIKYVFKTA